MSTKQQQIFAMNYPKISAFWSNFLHLTIWIKTEILTGPSIAETHANEQQRRNLVQEYERKFEQLSINQKLSKPCSEAGLNLVEIGQFFYEFDAEEGQQMQHLCRGYTMLRNEVDSYKRMDFQEYENRSSLEHKNF